MIPRSLLFAALTASPLLAQIAPVPCSPVQYDFPNAGGFKVLRAINGNNPYGMPQPPSVDCSNQNVPWWWPVSVTVGDIDNDGVDDLLFCGEQRFLLAVRIKDATGTPLTTPTVIWLYFDEDGDIHKHRWGADRAAIGDFDGDGDNEVAAVIGPQSPTVDSSNVLALFEEPVGSGLQQILNPLNEPSPDLRTWARIDDFAISWTDHASDCPGSHAYGHNFNVNKSRLLATGTLEEIFLSGTESGRMAVMIYDPSNNQLVELFSRGATSGASHYIQPFDVNGDGHDDFLTNGVLDLWNRCEWTLADLPPYTISPSHTQNNHADTLVPWRNGSGPFDLLLLHDDYDMLVSNGANCSTPVRYWENTRRNDLTQAVPHGQRGVVAKLLDGPDAFGYTGKHAVTTPKGAPLYGNGSVVLNRDAKELLIANNNQSSTPIGPTQVQLQVVQWDGGTTEEILSFSHNRDSIWRLVHDGIDPHLPYHFEEVFGRDRQSGPSAILAQSAFVNDYYPGGNDEVMLVGIRGYVVLVPPCQ